MTDLHRFGDPKRFEIAARWLEDDEARDRLPKDFGWSMGELCITVGGVCLTQHRIHDRTRLAVQWYLGPVIAWMLGQWKWLMHEEAYAWSGRPGDSAAFTVEAAIERYMGSTYPNDRDVYRQVVAWWKRHALRAAAASALYPPVLFRRMEDSIEVSWLDRQPEFAPDGFELNLSAGVALLAVEEVARPLWHFLEWAVSSADASSEEDLAQIDALQKQFAALAQIDARELEAAHATKDVLKTVADSVGQNCWMTTGSTLDHVPVITQFDAPVFMFGGLNVDIGANDIQALFDVMVAQHGGREQAALSALVSSPSIFEYLQPYTHGYELAYQIREAFKVAADTAFVDIEALLSQLDVDVVDIRLQTSSIRGVAIAGSTFAPTIVVNTSHRFNQTARGRRFTLAHELCHILFDRSRAKRLSHISGPWSSPRVEKRANAFAAMFLATPHALGKAMAAVTRRDAAMLRRLVEAFEIGPAALLEHMRNLDLISDDEFNVLGVQRR